MRVYGAIVDGKAIVTIDDVEIMEVPKSHLVARSSLDYLVKMHMIEKEASKNAKSVYEVMSCLQTV